MHNANDNSFDLHPLFSSYCSVYEKFINNVLFLRPEDFLQIEHNFFAKQMDIFISNGHHTLNYMKEFCALFENMWSLNTGQTPIQRKTAEKYPPVRAAKKKNREAPLAILPATLVNSPLDTNASMDVMHQYTEKMKEYAADTDADNKVDKAHAKNKSSMKARIKAKLEI